MTALRIEVRLRDLPDYSSSVSRYPDRGPLSHIWLSGDFSGGGVELSLGTTNTPEHAEAEAVAAEQFAAWAADHAAACREHADRVKADAETVPA